MSKTEQPAEVNAYLRRLDADLRDVPRATAREIREGIREELASLPPEQARERIVQLGDPAFIAAEARAGTESPARPSVLASRGYIVVASLVVVIGGVVIPLVGWLIGYVLVCVSPAWRRWEKVLAVAVPIGAALAAAAYFVVAELHVQTAVAGQEFQPLPLSAVSMGNAAVALMVANVGIGIWLMVRALRRH